MTHPPASPAEHADRSSAVPFGSPQHHRRTGNDPDASGLPTGGDPNGATVSETAVGPGRVRIAIPVPPLLSARRPLPDGAHVAPGQISLAFVTGNGLRIAVSAEYFHAVAQYEREVDSVVLGVEVHPQIRATWGEDEVAAADLWVRALHSDADRIMVEAFAAFEDAVLAQRRGSELPCPDGWEHLLVDVFELDPLRGQRVAVALAASQRLNSTATQ